MAKIELSKGKLSKGKIRGIIYGIIGYVIFILIFVYLPKPFHGGPYTDTPFPQINIEKTDRVLVVSPHPDDAALSSSGIIEKCIEKGAEVKVLYVTCGSHNTDTMVKKNFVPNPVSAIALARTRNREAINAMHTLGLSKNDLIFFGFPDFGTLKIWTDYFNGATYFDGLTLHRSVFCKYAYKRGVPFTAKEELSLFEEVLEQYKPTKIFYSTTYDLNSDHRATGLFLEAAVLDLEAGKLKDAYENGTFHPELYTYFMHAEGWPVPVGYHPSMYLPPPAYVYHINKDFVCDVLTRSEEAKKEQAIRAHKSQVDTKADFMLSFVRKDEIFLPFSFNILGKPLPVWSREVSQKFGITPFVSGAEITDGEKYVNFHITLYEGLPALTKLNVFIFPFKGGTQFADMPKYRLVVERLVGHTLSVKLYNNGKYVYAKRASLSGTEKNLTLDIEFPKKYLDGADGFFSSVMLETGIVRTSETPWWCIDLSNSICQGSNF